MKTDEAQADAAQALAELGNLSWKLCEALERELAFAASDRAESGAAMLRFARRRMETILAGQELRLVTYEGEPWDAKIPPSPLNPDEMEGAAALVDSTVEPTFLGPQGVVRAGKVLLRKA